MCLAHWMALNWRKANHVASKIVAHTDKVSYQQVITKSYSPHPRGRDERATEEDRVREKEKKDGEEKMSNCLAFS